MAEESKTAPAAGAGSGAGVGAGGAPSTRKAPKKSAAELIAEAQASMPSFDGSGGTAFELVAFPTRGEAEVVRLLMAQTATKYTESTVTFKKAAKYKKTLKLGRLPVMFDDRTCTEIGTPLAMLRHVARVAGADGSTASQRAQADLVADVVSAHNAAFRRVACVRFVDTLELAKQFAPGGPVHQLLVQLTSLLDVATNRFAGPDITYADIMAFDALDVLMQIRPTLLRRAPDLHKFYTAIAELPRVAAYLAKRRASDFSASGPHPLPTNSPVCVTGANGYIASHLVKQLLERGYRVRGTARNIEDDTKVGHLKALPGADERLELIQADLLTDGAFDEAVAGCDVVFHTASPFFQSDKREELIEPALQGTKNVLNSCKKAGAKKVVLTSSTAAIYLNRHPKGHLTTEADWTDLDFAEEKRSFYFISKTLAEKAAWAIAEEDGCPFKLVVMNPTLVIGPALQPKLNTSIAVFMKLVKDDDNTNRCLVDVRDVALAHIRGAERNTAQGRYLLMTSSAPAKLYARLFWANMPEDKAAAHTPEGTNDEPPVPFYFSCVKARKELGLEFMPVEQTIADTARSIVAREFM